MQQLQLNGNSIDTFIQNAKGTIINYGSKFRSPLLMHYPHWGKYRLLLTSGSNWPLKSLPNRECIAKNNEFIKCGNHKSATKYKEVYHSILLGDINQGWMIPLPLEYMNSLQHGELTPVGIKDSQTNLGSIPKM